MEYHKMKATGITVSKLCLGTMTFGGKVSEEDGIKMIHEALWNGINFIDTANIYQNGASETIVGKALRGRRDEVVLATKVGSTYHPEKMNSKGLNRKLIIKELEESLKRLQTDYIDLYYLHVPDSDTSCEETIDTLSDLTRIGKIRYWGVSNFASWQLADMIHSADSRNASRPISSENVYNLLCRSIEPELVPCMKKHGIGMTVFNPLAGGLLTGKHSYNRILEGSRFDHNASYQNRYWNEDSFRGVDLLRPIAEREGISLAEFSIKWCAQHDFIDSVILGASSIKQLEDNLHALDSGILSESAMKACDEVWKVISGSRYQYNR